MKHALTLLQQYGEMIIKGEYTDADIMKLCDAALVNKDAKTFINLLMPFLTPQGLHDFNAALLRHAMNQNPDTYLRAPTGNLIKACLIYEAKQYGLFTVSDNEIAQKLSAAAVITAEFYSLIHLSDAIKDHFAKIVLPATEMLTSYQNNPEQDLTMRYYFNIINPVIFSDIQALIKDNAATCFQRNGNLLSKQLNESVSTKSQSTSATPTELTVAASTFMRRFHQEVHAYRDQQQKFVATVEQNGLSVDQKVQSLQFILNMCLDSNESYSVPVNSHCIPNIVLDAPTHNALTQSFGDFLTAYNLLVAQAQETVSLYKNKVVYHRNHLPQKSKPLDVYQIILQMSDLLRLHPMTIQMFNLVYDNLRKAMSVFIDGLSHSNLPKNEQYDDNISELMKTYGKLCALMESVRQLNQCEMSPSDAPRTPGESSTSTSTSLVVDTGIFRTASPGVVRASSPAPAGIVRTASPAPTARSKSNGGSALGASPMRLTLGNQN